MENDVNRGIQDVSGGGLSGQHPSPDPFKLVVAPTNGGELNTVRFRLVPIACWRVEDIRFAFDSSFLPVDPDSDPERPGDIREELKLLKDLVSLNPGCPLTVFGHADPVGNDNYNKTLSGRRATAIYALLISPTDPGTAVKLWQQISATEHWGADQRDGMLTLTGLPENTPDSDLIRAYLQAVCPADLRLTKEDFLARGADRAGKGDYQGCGEFNPLLIFSQEKQHAFDEAARQNDQSAVETRNELNGPNRRVAVLMFRKGSRVDPARWPCPRVNEGIEGCVKRFFSDGEKRRSTHLPDDVDRRFEDKNDTFACRFYQRISNNSPCEKVLPTDWDDFPLPPQKEFKTTPQFEGPPAKVSEPIAALGLTPGMLVFAATTTGTGFPTFEEGPPVRPKFPHDHGFLDDGNGNIDNSKRRNPTFHDRLLLAKWRKDLVLAETAAATPQALVPGPLKDKALRAKKLKDALPAYDHFHFGGGSTRTVDYESFLAGKTEGFVDGDLAGPIVLNSLIEDTRAAAIELDEIDFPDPASSPNVHKFEMRSSVIAVGGRDPRYPYPATENWQKAIGAHFLFVTGKVDVQLDPAAKTRAFTVSMTVLMEDMYNFNPGNVDIATGIPDKENGIFEVTGLGHEYLNTAEVKRVIAFTVPFGPLPDKRVAPSNQVVTKPSGR